MSSQLLASKIVIVEEEPAVRTINPAQDSIAGFLGVAEKGPIGTATLVTSVAEYDSLHGGYVANGDLRQAIDGFFANGGGACYVVRTVHYSDVTDKNTKTSAKAAVTILSAAAAATGGFVLGSIVGPYNLEPADTILVTTDAGGPSTATFSATAAARESAAENFALSNGQILTVSIDGGPVQTITFLTASFSNIGAATAEEVRDVINGILVGGRATATSSNTKVTITSDRRGTGSGVNVTGGNANTALAFTTGNIAGTGNVSNIDAVTVAEIKTVVEAAVAGVTVTDVGGAPKITRNTTGTGSTVQVTAASTADDEIGFDNAVHAGQSGSAVGTLRLDGKWDGTYAHSFKGIVSASTSGAAAEFNLTVLKNGVIVETFPNLSMDDTAERYVETIINNATTGSKHIAAVDLDAGTGSATTDRPANGTTANLSGGSDGLGSLADTDFTGADGANGKTGLRVFDIAQDMSILAVPGRATSAVHNAMLTYCETIRDMSMMAILDPPAGLSATAIVTYFETTAAVLGLSEFGAAYWPRVKVLNPNKSVFGNTDDIVVPPSGHIAGVYARVAGAKPGGVYTPPAGVENGILAGVIGFETDEVLEEPKRDIVYPKRINPLTAFVGSPRHIDGTKTLKGGGNFPSVSERRGATFIEQSIKQGLQFARHKNNDEELRAQVSRSITAFLLIQMNNGAFRTKNPATAFSVDVSDALNPPALQFAGQLRARIGLATQKPTDFIILSFSQDTRALLEELAA